MAKIIITAALVGGVPTRKDTPYVPLSPDEMAADAKACYEAGAAIVHVHARDNNGLPTLDFDIFNEIHTKIKKVCPEVIVQISTGGRAGNGEARAQGLKVNPETASFNPGSINFATMIYENPPDLVQMIAEEMAKRKILPEAEIFDISMIQPVVDLFYQGIFKAPLYFNFVMGMKNIQPATFDQVAACIHALPREIPCNWNISGVGKNQLFTTYLGIALGGNIRVGIEDNVFLSKGVYGTNAQFVERAVMLSKTYGRTPATPDEARQILGLAKV